MLPNGLGGSEKAVNYMAKYLALTKEFNIYVSGDVDDEIIHNVHYIHRIHRSKLRELITKTPFHTVYGVVYYSMKTKITGFTIYYSTYSLFMI
jgi:hypothetical protein